VVVFPVIEDSHIYVVEYLGRKYVIKVDNYSRLTHVMVNPDTLGYAISYSIDYKTGKDKLTVLTLLTHVETTDDTAIESFMNMLQKLFDSKILEEKHYQYRKQ